jgi:trehalose 6-phosphate phosphatase
MSAVALPSPPGLRPGAIALFLDVDGTLVKIEREPRAVHVPARLRQLLAALQRATAGALALVSGRPLEQLDQLFAPLQLSAAGLHGLERRTPGGDVVRARLDPIVLAAARERLGGFAARHPGVLLEDKGMTLALHYRLAPAQQAAAARLVQEMVAASQGRLVLLEGKMVLELKPPDSDKGQAIAAFMAEAPFAGRQPVFAGDDLTDEAGFALVNRSGGISIRIGADPRPTAATHGLPDVGAVEGWLAGLLAEVTTARPA